LKVAVWLQPTGGAPRVGVASRSDACFRVEEANIRGCRAFRWRHGYGAFSVSKSQDAQVKAYISKQRQHHRKKTFQEEYRGLLDRHEIECNERHLWD